MKTEELLSVLSNEIWIEIGNDRHGYAPYLTVKDALTNNNKHLGSKISRVYPVTGGGLKIIVEYEPDRTKIQYELWEYDVWGNEEDGFEINDWMPTGVMYEFMDSAADIDIIHDLCTKNINQKGSWLKPEAENKVEIQDRRFDSDVIVIQEIETLKPIGELRIRKMEVI